MEIALIHNNSLELGPMGFNVKYINADLEDLEVEERISLLMEIQFKYQLQEKKECCLQVS